eukprot:CAMPEP_0115744224 /NCGR_PEP_ID=MMETSP0272-20121206/91492_1 /TAXON_ID=71861 /ORGANISM="Scrippsiella trochoidea, Strain CCMP3099" /LENGTH=54 /DNA_ID=CAMNT_0003189089 /DNA_START=366 /DNA_END=530 /DNA_ORIENTATION=+
MSPRLLRGGHLQDRATEAPDISFAAMAILLQNDLWRHPGYGADRCEGLCINALL